MGNECCTYRDDKVQKDDIQKNIVNLDEMNKKDLNKTPKTDKNSKMFE